MPWKTITVPKAVYLPTLAPDGQFKNSGIRVEPTDKVEIESGTHNININGAIYQLFVACDTLRLDSKNCLILDAPAPPIANISASGGGRAFVGGIGQATAAARGNWDHAAAAKWKGDAASPVGKEWVEAQIRHADQHVAFQDVDDEFADGLFKDSPEDTPKEARRKAQAQLKLLEDERVVRTVTLKDGTQAEVLIDPSTGRQAGTVSRTYAGPGIDPKEVTRLMAEQAQDARDVSSQKPNIVPLTRPEPVHKVAATIGPPTASQSQGTPSGFGPIFDGFLQSVLNLAPPGGFQQGTVTFLQLEGDLVLHLGSNPWTSTPSCELAFARIHKAPGVFLSYATTKTQEHVLDLAEHLPALVEATATTKAALVILAPWTQGLLTSLPQHHILLGRHATDPRFLTATLLRAHGQTLPNPKTVSWPERPSTT